MLNRILDRFESLMLYKIGPPLVVLNLIWATFFIVTDGWTWMRVVSWIVAVGWVEVFHNVGAPYYRKK
jgi:hypothetical protein